MKEKSILFYINEISTWKESLNNLECFNNHKDVYGLINFFHNWFLYKDIKIIDFLKELWEIDEIHKDVTKLFLFRKKYFELFNLFGVVVEEKEKKYWNIPQKETILLILAFFHNLNENNNIYFNFLENHKLIYFKLDLSIFIKKYFKNNCELSRLINYRIKYEKNNIIKQFLIKKKNLNRLFLKILENLTNILILYLKQNLAICFKKWINTILDCLYFENNYVEDTKLFLLHELQKEIFFIKNNEKYFNKWNLALKIYDFISLYVAIMKKTY